MATLALQVNASTDDASESGGGSMFTTASYFVLGSHFVVHSGARFTGVSGLSGATINTAVLTFRAYASGSGPFVADWYADDRVDPPTFGGGAGNTITSRTRTTATCEGDGGDYQNWTVGQDFTFDGITPASDTDTIADIIQELADSYDPGEIALLSIWSSGAGERLAVTYNNTPATAPKLAIDFTAATGDTTVFPDPVPIHIAIPTPTLGLQPTPVAIHVAIPTPTLGLQPTPVPIHIAIPTPQIIAGVTVYPKPVEINIAIPTPTLGLQPTPVPIHIAIPTPVASPSPVTVSPSPVAIHVAIITPILTGGGGAEEFTAYGVWDATAQEYVGLERFLDPSLYATGTQFLLEVGLATSAAVNPVTAFLYNVTDSQKVVGSDVTSTATLFEVVRSSSFDLLALFGAGLKKYELRFGGVVGGDFGLWGGDVLEVSS